MVNDFNGYKELALIGLAAVNYFEAVDVANRDKQAGTAVAVGDKSAADWDVIRKKILLKIACLDYAISNSAESPTINGLKETLSKIMGRSLSSSIIDSLIQPDDITQ